MANAFVSIVQQLNKSGELRKRLAGDEMTSGTGAPHACRVVKQRGRLPPDAINARQHS